MSLSRAELEAMDRDELVETITELAQRVDDTETTATVAADSLWDLEDVVVGETSVGVADGQLPADGLFGALTELREANERLREENQTLRGRLDDVEATAQAALQATAGTDDDRSQTEIAAALTRNWLVVKAANDCPPRDRPVTIGEVRERAKPEHALDWQTVRNGWDNILLQEWPQFHETTKRGAQAVSLRPDKVTPALAKVAQADLGRDDLAKRFVGDNSGGGG